MKGKHSINLYVDFDNEIAGHFVTGHYQAHKAMLIAAAQENPSFGRAFLDAALEYANWINQTEIGVGAIAGHYLAKRFKF
jgi:riboflavin synthase alpha subunit